MRNRQSAAKLPTNEEERSTTMRNAVEPSGSKRGASIIKIDEDIVWAVDESLQKVNKK